MKIEFIGAQGTGKSSIAKFLKGNGIPIIDNVVRDLIDKHHISINERGNINSQWMIFDAYYHVLNEYPDFISTRSLFDVVAYSQYISKKSKEDIYQDVLDQVDELKEYLKYNKDVIYVYFPIEFEIKDDGVRSVDKAYQKEIDQIIQYRLKYTKTPFYTVHGSIEERVRYIEDLMDQIEEKGVKNNQIKK